MNKLMKYSGKGKNYERIPITFNHLDFNPTCNACKRYSCGKQSKASGLGILVKRVFPTHSTKLSAKELADLTKQMLIDLGYIK